MPRAEFHPAARREFDRAMDHYEAERRGLGHRFKSVVEAQVRRIELNVMTGFPSEFNTRTALLRRFPYRVVYRELTGRLVILAIAHFAREPEYWHSRIDDVHE